MNIINFLFSFFLTGNFPNFFINELMGIKNLMLINYLSLNLLIIFFKKNISIKLNRLDIVYIIFFCYIIIYFFINNQSLRSALDNEFYLMTIKNLLLPYLTGRFVYKFLNKNLLKNMFFMFCLYFLILTIILFLRPESFLNYRFIIYDFPYPNYYEIQLFLTNGVGYFLVCYLALLKDPIFIQKIKSNLINKRIIFFIEP